MNLNFAKKSLNIFSYIFIFFAVAILGLGIYGFVNFSVISESLIDFDLSVLGDMDPKIVFLIGCIVVAALYCLYAYLLRKAIKDGKKTTALLVLLVIGIIGCISTIVKTFTVSNLVSLLLEVFVLWQVLIVRKESN